MTIPAALLDRILGDPGNVAQLRRDVAAWIRAHPEDADALRDGMHAVEQVEMAKVATGRQS